MKWSAVIVTTLCRPGKQLPCMPVQEACVLMFKIEVAQIAVRNNCSCSVVFIFRRLSMSDVVAKWIVICSCVNQLQAGTSLCALQSSHSYVVSLECRATGSKVCQKDDNTVCLTHESMTHTKHSIALCNQIDCNSDSTAKLPPCTCCLCASIVNDDIKTSDNLGSQISGESLTQRLLQTASVKLEISVGRKHS